MKVADRRCPAVGVLTLLFVTHLMRMILRLFLVVLNTARRGRPLTTCNGRLVVINRLIRFRVVTSIRLIVLLTRRLVGRVSGRGTTCANLSILKLRVTRVMRPCI